FIYNPTNVTPGTASDSFTYDVSPFGAQIGPNANSTAQGTVNITIAQPPTDIALSATTVIENGGANLAIGQLTSTDPDSTVFTYSLVAGAGAMDNAAFAINGDQLVILASADFETKSSYSVRVRTTDNTNAFFEKTFTIAVTDVNDTAPTLTSLSFTIDENIAAVGQLTSTDPDGGTTTYSITSNGPDDALFSIDGAGNLSFQTPPDFDNQNSQAGTDVYTVQIQTSDGVNTGTPTNVTITVNNVNDIAPTFTSSNAVAIDENTTAVLQVLANDAPENDLLTYRISGGNDAALFTLDSSGNLAFITAPDFDVPGSNAGSNTYIVQVEASDGVNTTTQDITVTVNDVNEAPNITSAATFSIAENSTAVGQVTAIDPESAALSYTISGGADSALFTIDGSGNLSFTNAPDFDIPGSSAGSNVYEVQVQVTDGINLVTQAIAVTVTNVDEAPLFSSSATFAIDENSTAVGQVTAIDPEGAPITYTIIGGDDGGKFTIDPNTGALAFLAAPDFETATDADTNNVYLVQVQASDGGQTTLQSISVTVNDLAGNEPPIITSNNAFSIAENTTTVGQITAVDPESGTLTFGITGSGADDGLFTIDGAGNLVFSSARDFETPSSAASSNNYVVQVSITDNGNNTVTQDITVTVTDVNEPPVINSGNTFSIAENATAVGQVLATDPESTPLSYSISGGADSGLFTIDGSGNLSFTNAPDFEVPGSSAGSNVYGVQVQVTDGINPVTQDITVTVNDVNEAPIITSAATFSIAENSTAVGQVTAIDPESTPLSYSISGGADSGLFTIDGSGNLSFANAPDFDIPGSSAGSNVYEVQVQVTDGINPATQAIAVTVTNVDEAPLFSSSNTFAIDENSTAVGQVIAIDPEGATLTYAIDGTGADDSLFTIDSAGNLAFNTAPDFETPSSSGSSNDYLVKVTVGDGSNFVTQDITVTVNNANDVPTIQDFTVSGLEDQPITFGIGDFTDSNKGNFQDQDSDQLASVKVVTLPGSGALTFNNSTVTTGDVIAQSNLSQFVYTPNANVNGTAIDSFQILVIDDQNGESAPKIVTIDLEGINDAPTFALASNAVADTAGTKNKVLPNFAINISAGPNETSQTTAFDVAVGSDANGILDGIPTLGSDGSLNYSLTDKLGTATIRLSLQDNGGTANGGVDTSSVIEFTIESQSSNVPGVSNSIIPNITGENEIISSGLVFEVIQDGNLALASAAIANATSAVFDNLVGLYRVVDVNGGIDTNNDGIADVTPDDLTNYARAALTTARVTNFNLRAGGIFTTAVRKESGNVLLLNGQLYAPFVIANGGNSTVENFVEAEDAELDGVFNNAVTDNSRVAYFSYIAANPDGVAHIRSNGAGIFGFEDLPGGGDNDFNDAVFSIDLV
ncbi:MAG: DUF4114 domain-containing protein, partial [Synechococcaceae cyanobacterium RL_1_2]|nr:DUF4114 domain-containing protein [Synechococcaceae cyanobacterium RL_1_2]